MNPQYKVKNIKHDLRDGRYTLSVFRTIQHFVSIVYFPLDTRLAIQRLLTSLGGTKPLQVPLDQLRTPDQIRGWRKIPGMLIETSLSQDVTNWSRVPPD